ncbi:hypothetical protein ACF0H5_004535 [Mactra antiquata]
MSLSIKELRNKAKQKGLRGYSQLKKEELEKLLDEHSKMEAQIKRFLNYQQSILDRPNPDIGVEPLKPTKTTVQKIKDTVKDTVIDWSSWLAEKKTVPVIKKVSENLQKLKDKVAKLFQTQFELKQHKSAFKNFTTVQVIHALGSEIQIHIMDHSIPDINTPILEPIG